MKKFKLLMAVALVSVFVMSCKETPKPEVEEVVVEEVVEEVVEVAADTTAVEVAIDSVTVAE